MGNADVCTPWIALFCKRIETVCFNNFAVEHVREKVKTFIGNKKIKANTFRVQANNLIVCGYFSIEFIDFMLAGKKMTNFMNVFSPHDFGKNDHIILSYFKDE